MLFCIEIIEDSSILSILPSIAKIGNHVASIPLILHRLISQIFLVIELSEMRLISDSNSDNSLISKSDVRVKSKSRERPPRPEKSTRFGDTLQAIGNPSTQRTEGDFSKIDIEVKISSMGSLTIKAESGIVSIIGYS